MDNKNLLSKKVLRESYEEYSGYFEKIIQNVIKNAKIDFDVLNFQFF